MSRNRKIFLFVVLPLLTGLAITIGLTINRPGSSTVQETSNQPEISSESSAFKAGKEISRGCQGEGFPYKLTTLPMKETDFSIVIPYGLMVGGHVTPIDHQYFAPAEFNSSRDAYEVYAMADATITDISERATERGTEYRLVFSITCNYFYYYDLVTSLTTPLKDAYLSSKNNQRGKPISVPVKAGELIGRIGGQTLDFAVWDTTKPLTGFIYPEHYRAENWKVYTADPLDYYTDDLKAKVLSRSPRTVEPISGKIDYDLKGKLIGNWFEEGTNWYGGKTNGSGGEYWGGHLSFAPDHYDPTQFIVSIGNFAGQAKQFTTVNNSPKPEVVTKEDGLIKYELVMFSYVDTEGRPWLGGKMTRNPKVKPQTGVQGCALVQMTDDTSLRFESFPNQACNKVTGQTAKAKTYTR